MGQIKLILFLVLATIFLIGCSKEEIEKRKAVRLLNEIKENLQKDNFEEVMKKSLFIIKWESYPRAPGFFISTARLIIINFPLEFSPLNDNAKKLFLQYMNETETRSRLNAEYFKFDKIVNFKMNGNRYILKTLASYKNPFTGELIGEEHYYCFLKKSDKIYLLLGINIKDALEVQRIYPLEEQILGKLEYFFGKQLFAVFYENAGYKLSENLLPITRTMWFEKGTEGINETLRPIIAKENIVWSENTDLGGGDSIDKSNHETEYKLACERANKKDCESECCELFRKGELAKDLTLKMCFETLCK